MNRTAYVTRTKPEPETTMNTTTRPKTLTVRCRPFSGGRVAAHRVRVETDGSVTVWDEVAGHYTRCHVLSESACRRIVRLAAK